MTVEIKVASMVCQVCANTISKAIKSLDAEADITINLETKIVNINGKPSETEIKEAITAVGHTVD